MNIASSKKSISRYVTPPQNDKNESNLYSHCINITYIHSYHSYAYLTLTIYIRYTHENIVYFMVYAISNYTVKSLKNM